MAASIVCVRAKADIPANKLKLAPASMNMASIKPANNACVAVEAGPNGALYLQPYSTLIGDKKWMAPYWHVGYAAKPKDANMEVRWERKVICGVTVHLPTLINIKPLKTGDMLQKVKGKTNYDRPDADGEPAAKRIRDFT